MDRIIIIVSLVALAVLLSGAALLMPPINEAREDLELTFNDDVQENLPPEIALTQAALGSFRGLAVDVLWARATRMKQEGKHYEAMQLADWITKLQPRFAAVWRFHAWNQAYNISVTTQTPEERWMWVQAGVNQLRNEGIPLNPRAVSLYKELATIFLHKIEGFTDDMNWYYKSHLAARWHALLGPPPEGTSEEAVAWFRPIATAYERYVEPDAESGRTPLDRLTAAVPETRDLLDTLAGWGLKPNAELLRRLSSAESVRQSADLSTLALQEEQSHRRSNDRLRAWMSDPEIAEARGALLAFVRAKVVSEKYHMDPSWMLTLMKGRWFLSRSERAEAERLNRSTAIPIDWRHPAAHGLYWSSKGVRVSQDLLTPDDYDALNTDRLVIHSLQSLTRSGRLIFDPVSGYYRQLNDPRFIDAYNEAVYGAPERIASKRLRESAAEESFKAGRENFLIWSVKQFYWFGDMDKAREYYATLRDEFSDYRADRVARYSKPLDRFVLEDFAKSGDITTLQDVRTAIMGLITRSFTDGLAVGRAEAASRFLEQARRAYGMYQSKQENPSVNADRGRQDMPPFDEMLADALSRYLLSPARGQAAVLTRTRVWRNAPAPLKRRVFPRIQEKLYRQMRQVGLKPEAAFPPPQGMEADQPRGAETGGGEGGPDRSAAESQGTAPLRSQPTRK